MIDHKENVSLVNDKTVCDYLNKDIFSFWPMTKVSVTIMLYVRMFCD